MSLLEFSKPMESKTIILKEIDLKDCLFNLKSISSGKYSVQDSYRDNLSNGFLVKINAPEDINSALRDIYYATEKGIIISYKEFNNKIVAIRNEILSSTFPGKEIKDLPKEEKLRIEMTSAKKVLKDLSINEATKLFYSPEFTLSKFELDQEHEKVKFKYYPENMKIVFFKFREKKPEIVKTQEEIDERKELIQIYLDFSEIIKPLTEKALQSYNLDEIELTLLSFEKFLNDLPDFAKSNKDIETLYLSNKDKLVTEAGFMKERQENLDAGLNDKINTLLGKQEYKKIKAVIYDIENEFEENKFICSDTKSNTIKDLAIEKLKNIGKTIALIVLKEWDSKNLKIAENLLKQNLPGNLEIALKKKYTQEATKLSVEEEKLLDIDFKDSNAIYNKFRTLSKQKDVFNRFFEIMTEKSFDLINTIIEDLKSEYSDFIILQANYLTFKNFNNLWKNLSLKIIDKMICESFLYQTMKTSKTKDLYFKSILEYEAWEALENIFKNIKSKLIKRIEINLLAEILTKLQPVTLETVSKKILPPKLLVLTQNEIINNNLRVNNIIINTLLKWLPALDIESEEFWQILQLYPEKSIYKLKRRQINLMSPEKILEIIDLIKPFKEVLEYFILLAGKENFESVLKIKLKSMVVDEPSNFENHYNLGITYLETNELDSAVLEFKRCLGLNPESHESHYFLALTLEKLGQNEEAISEYKKASQLKYGYIDAYYNLGLLYNKQREFFLATQQFKKVLKIDPENYEACISLGIAYDEMGESDTAASEYEKAISINPTKSAAYINLAVNLSLKDKNDEAINLYSKAIVHDPENPRIQYNLGILFQQQKNFPQAIAHYKLAIRLDPLNSEAYNNLGLIYFFREELKKAKEYWQKAIEINNNIDAYNNLGWVYYVDNELDKSAEIYEKAKLINPKHSILSMNLGTVYYKKNDISKAIKELENYLFLEPNSEDAYEIIKILKNLRALK